MSRTKPCVEMTFQQAGGAPGSGRKALRTWSERQPCCLRPAVRQVVDGRFRCAGCGTWYSASHSGPVLGCARSAQPVGIDVQMDCHRPAAMRRVAKICGVGHGTIAHWTVVEAIWKATGRVGGVPEAGSCRLPEVVPGRGTVHLPGAGSVSVVTGVWSKDAATSRSTTVTARVAVAVLEATAEPSCGRPSWAEAGE